MKNFKNPHTGEIFTESEIKDLCSKFYFEAGHESPEEYLNYMIDNHMIVEA